MPPGWVGRAPMRDVERQSPGDIHEGISPDAKVFQEGSYATSG